MIGEQLLFFAELLDSIPEPFQVIGAIDVRRFLPHLRKRLSENGAAEAILAATDIDQNQTGIRILDQLRRKR